MDDDASEEEDDLLVPREKTRDEIEKDEEDYRAWLQREVGADLRELVTVEPVGNEVEVGPVEEPEEEGKKKKKKKKDKSKEEGAEKDVRAKSASKEDVDQQFLLEYVLHIAYRGCLCLIMFIVISSTVAGLTAHPAVCQPTMKSRVRHPRQRRMVYPPPQRIPTVRMRITRLATCSQKTNSRKWLNNLRHRITSASKNRMTTLLASRLLLMSPYRDAGTIKTYPRNLASTVRREDTTRKEAREKRKARKEEEKLKKREEVKRLKALKMKELKAKLERIGKEAGRTWTEAEEERGQFTTWSRWLIQEAKATDLALQALDLDADWDPIAHEKQMGALYGREGGDEDSGYVDAEKPAWDDDIDIDDIAPDWNDNEAGFSHLDAGEGTSQKKKKKKKKKDVKDGDEAHAGVDVDMMDAERVEESGQWDDVEWDGTEEMRKKVWDKYMEELDAMEFNDMVRLLMFPTYQPLLNRDFQVGDLPTRFKYTPVQPDNFGLTPAEILLATDAELNSYVGLKKFAPYRTKAERKWDNKRNERLQELRKGLKERGAYSIIEDMGSRDRGGDGEKKKKRKGKKERMKAKADAEGGEDESEEKLLGKRKSDELDAGAEDAASKESKKRRRRHKKAAAE